MFPAGDNFLRMNKMPAIPRIKPHIEHILGEEWKQKECTDKEVWVRRIVPLSNWDSRDNITAAFIGLPTVTCAEEYEKSDTPKRITTPWINVKMIMADNKIRRKNLITKCTALVYVNWCNSIVNLMQRVCLLRIQRVECEHTIDLNFEYPTLFANAGPNDMPIWNLSLSPSLGTNLFFISTTAVGTKQAKVICEPTEWACFKNI